MTLAVAATPLLVCVGQWGIATEIFAIAALTPPKLPSRLSVPPQYPGLVKEEKYVVRVLKLHIDRWSYWLGLASAVIALVMRTFNAFGFLLPGNFVQGITIWYMSFFKGALLFLLINIATTLRVHLRMMAEQDSRMPTETRVVASPPAKKFKTVAAGF